MARHELDQQDYNWSFQLTLGPNGMDEQAAQHWLTNTVERAASANANVISRMRSITFPHVDGCMEQQPAQCKTDNVANHCELKHKQDVLSLVAVEEEEGCENNTRSQQF